MAGAYGDWGDAGGAAAQLAINLAGIVVAGVLTLVDPAALVRDARRRHLLDPARGEAGLPLGHSARRRG